MTSPLMKGFASIIDLEIRIDAYGAGQIGLGTAAYLVVPRKWFNAAIA